MAEKPEVIHHLLHSEGQNLLATEETIMNRGVVAGAHSAGPGSGLAFLFIELEDGSSFTVPGDWRMIQRIAEELEGEEVEVVDGEEGGVIRLIG